MANNIDIYIVQVEYLIDGVVYPFSYEFGNFYDALQYYHDKCSQLPSFDIHNVFLFKVISQYKDFLIHAPCPK